nr:hypothetical protein [Evansella caseinilytica]
MSHTSPRSYELTHCVIARDGTWIDIKCNTGRGRDNERSCGIFSKAR